MVLEQDPYRALRAFDNPCTKACDPSPVARLADHTRSCKSMTPFGVEFISCSRIAFLGKVRLEGDTRSNLLKRKYVDAFIRPWTLAGIIISRARAEGGPSISGSGRTQRDMSELITLDHFVSLAKTKKMKTYASLPRLTPISSTMS